MTMKVVLGLLSSFDDRFIPDWEKLKVMVEKLKEAGYRIVLTQGVYDLVHLGHIRYLEVAKATGDILIVGIDSDQWARERKGPTRPIVPQDERAQILVSLRCVDIVTLIEGYGEGYRDLVEEITPDVLIVSETTKISDDRLSFFRQHAKFVKILPSQATVSTTARIRDIVADGAVGQLREARNIIDGMIGRLEQKEGAE